MRTAKTVLKYNTSDDYVRWIKSLPNRYHYTASIIQDIENIDTESASAIAFISEGDWVADCPSGCGSAMLVDPELPFMCGLCFNIELAGRWRPVKWPTEKSQIESLLEKRPIHRNHNWKPPETVADLEAENVRHGVV